MTQYLVFLGIAGYSNYGVSYLVIIVKILVSNGQLVAFSSKTSPKYRVNLPSREFQLDFKGAFTG